MRAVPSNKRATGSDDLTDDQALLWYGTISVGTFAKVLHRYVNLLLLLLVTHVAHCTLYHSQSTLTPAPAITSFPDPNVALRAKVTRRKTRPQAQLPNLGKTFSLSFGDGSTASGEQHTDTVSIAGLTVCFLF